MKYYYLADQGPHTVIKKGVKETVIPQESHGSVYTEDETICRFTDRNYDRLVKRVKRIAELLNEHGE